MDEASPELFCSELNTCLRLTSQFQRHCHSDSFQGQKTYTKSLKTPIFESKMPQGGQKVSRIIRDFSNNT